MAATKLVSTFINFPTFKLEVAARDALENKIHTSWNADKPSLLRIFPILHVFGVSLQRSEPEREQRDQDGQQQDGVHAVQIGRNPSPEYKIGDMEEMRYVFNDS